MIAVAWWCVLNKYFVQFSCFHKVVWVLSSSSQHASREILQNCVDFLVLHVHSDSIITYKQEQNIIITILTLSLPTCKLVTKKYCMYNTDFTTCTHKVVTKKHCTYIWPQGCPKVVQGDHCVHKVVCTLWYFLNVAWVQAWKQGVGSLLWLLQPCHNLAKVVKHR